MERIKWGVMLETFGVCVVCEFMGSCSDEGRSGFFPQLNLMR